MKKDTQEPSSPGRKPEWLKIRLPYGYKTKDVIGLLNDRHLNTICSSGMCPNRAECWGAGTATFMICGNICTRNCKFCNLTNSKPGPLDPDEIEKIAATIKSLELRHIVITSVDRDDLPDQGAAHWATTIRTLREKCAGITMETLIPDFQGDEKLIDLVLNERPDVVSHNLETVRRLTPEVRSVATYDRSLKVLRHIASKGIRAKSGIMLGLGETHDEILETMDDLLAVGCEVMTIGQYLQPTKRHYKVREYVHPDRFAEYAEIGRKKGFRHIESSPLVRSSYHAEKHIR